MIIGAGLAGMLAGYAFPHEPIFEAKDRAYIGHQALLRFGSPAISDLTGIEFRQVNVHKGIWLDGSFHEPTIRLCNMYAMKVVGELIDRSIWNIAPVVRWVPPTNFHERLVDGLGGRVHWDAAVNIEIFNDCRNRAGPVISTIPLPILASELLGYKGDFASAKIVATTAHIPHADIFQTVYFPSPSHGLYRASITGAQLICEWTGDDMADLGDVDQACTELGQAFGWDELYDYAMNSLESFHVQTFGKLSPLHKEVRQSLLVRLTSRFGIYSLGRFATWRNIMLDDVVKDIVVIKKLMAASDYDKRLIATALESQ